MYDLEPESVRKFLKEKDPNLVGIQLPSGLRKYCPEIKEVYDKQGVDVLFLAGGCFGACDIPDDQAEALGCDALVHYGHADMDIPSSLPVLYVEARIKASPLEALEEASPELECHVWGLTATVQHIDYIDEIREFLEERGIRTLVGDPGPRAKYPGQILGCDWGSAENISAEVDRFLYLGTGQFHPKGIVLSTGKPLISINPVTNDYEIIDPEIRDFLQKRAAVIANAESCQNFGILVSEKKGQRRLNLAKRLAKKLGNKGYNSCILAADEINFGDLADFQVEAIVNTACPRIPYSDNDRYQGPILTPIEAEVLLGEREWDNYQLDQIGASFEV